MRIERSTARPGTKASRMASKERPYLSAPTNREPQRACRGSAATSRVKPLGTGTRPPEPATGKIRAPPLRPTLFRYAPQLRAQRRKSPPKEGSRLDADRGRVASTGMLPNVARHEWGGVTESDRWRPWRGRSAWVHDARCWLRALGHDDPAFRRMAT